MDKDTVINIANLARIRVSEEETENLANELTNILTWIEELGEVDTESITAMTSVIDMDMPSREDLVNDGEDAERVLQNSPEKPDGGQKYFTVPKVIE